MISTASLVRNGENGEDRVRVEQCGERTLLVVADGAGGLGSGGLAADITCAVAVEKMRALSASSMARWERALLTVDLEVARRARGGHASAVMLSVTEEYVVGASVGDCNAWIVTPTEIDELTVAQRRKPLLGSAGIDPVSFGPVPLRGRLVVATDGLATCANVAKVTVSPGLAT